MPQRSCCQVAAVMVSWVQNKAPQSALGGRRGRDQCYAVHMTSFRRHWIDDVTGHLCSVAGLQVHAGHRGDPFALPFRPPSHSCHTCWWADPDMKFLLYPSRWILGPCSTKS